jgi:Zn-dependent protease with chaperone function
MRARIVVVAVWMLVVLHAPAALSQVPAGQSVDPSSPTVETPAPSRDQSRVAVPEPSEKAMARYRSGIVLWIADTIWGFVLPALILFTGVSARIRDWAVRIGRKRFFVIALYFAIFSVITYVIDLPRAYYEEFAREHAYGLSNQTFAKWISDSVTALLVSIVIGALFLWVPYWLLRKSPRRWWLYTGLLAVPFLMLIIVITPIFIEPLFNKFGPMKNKALEQHILQLASRAGIEGGRVYEVDKSTDTKALNAYVTGLGTTKRIVLWDTTIARLEEPELLFVMGHEMGHYVLGHLWKFVTLFSCLTLLTLYGIHRTAGWLIARYQAQLRFAELGDVASLPLLLLLIGLGFFVASPFALAYSRHAEHEADRFGLEITRDNHSAAMAFVKLQQDNLGNPRPHWLLKLLRADHPPSGERIDFCNDYRPWEHGQPLAYDHLFK